MDALLTLALIGSSMAAVVALHLHLTARLPEPAVVHQLDDIDAEFFRIVVRERLRDDAWPTR